MILRLGIVLRLFKKESRDFLKCLLAYIHSAMESIGRLQPMGVAQGARLAIRLAAIPLFNIEQVSKPPSPGGKDRGAREWLVPAASAAAELSVSRGDRGPVDFPAATSASSNCVGMKLLVFSVPSCPSGWRLVGSRIQVQVQSFSCSPLCSCCER